MSAFEERIKDLSPQQLALLAIDLKDRLEKKPPASSEPLAVVGLGCRLPGAAGPDEYWRLLCEGKDAISEVPAGRWNIDEYFDSDPATPGKMITRFGGFVENVKEFDHDFFGISKREADAMDPQQRLLLEVAWQTIENSNINPEELKGSPTGVFIGVCNSDFFVRQASGDIADLDMYVSTGTAHSVASGRLSYALGLQGPAVSVDTACSSSLVAVHLACQSLRQNECDLAFAGGVNLILLPEITVSLSQAGMLSPDGRCKAFDQSANGFVRGEGCGLVALKRLSDAEKNGDVIHAVILGSATNQDGRSHGLTAPNGPSQEAVIKTALGNAKLSPDDVTLIEAHGTGTTLGDPIEARALANVFGKRSGEKESLVVGSAKTNIGHAESAAGIAGLIKLILSARHRKIPQSLHFEKLNSHIEWTDIPIKISDRLQQWKGSKGRCIGGVSSFGFSGSNAHVVVANAPQRTVEPIVDNSGVRARILPLSARSDSALRELCRLSADSVRDISDAELTQYCRAAAVGRSHFSHRVGVAALSARQVSADLQSIANQESVDRAYQGRVDAKSAGQVAFLFPGQGSQYAGMGKELYETNAVFRECIDRCDEHVRNISDYSVLTAVMPASTDDEESIDQTELTQIAIFSVEYAMAEMWRSWGVRPSLVIGHSIGEYAAACVAGVFSLEDALKLVVARGQLTGKLPAGGSMAAVFADEATVQAAIEPYRDKVAIAAINGPGNTVLSGDRKSVEHIMQEMESAGISGRLLKISNAFHSPAVESILDEFESVVSTVELNVPAITVVSNVTGKVANAALLQSPQYWRRHLREPVHFMAAMRSAAAAGQRTFLEVGAHPVLTPLAMSCVPEGTANWVTTLKRGESDNEKILSAVSTLYAVGVPIDWRSFSVACRTDQISLPNYPFERVSCWPDARPTGIKPGARHGGNATGLKGHRINSPDLNDPVYESRISQNEPAYLSDHKVFEQVIMPSPAYIELAVAAARDVESLASSAAIEINSFSVHEALILPESGDIVVQTVVRPGTDGKHKFEIFAADASKIEHNWRMYSAGSISTRVDPEPVLKSHSVQELQGRMQFVESGDELYARLAELGLKFGRRFQCLKNIWSTGNEALGELTLPDDLTTGRGYEGVHPALLDSCFHLLDAVAPENEAADPFLLIGIKQIVFFGRLPTKIWAHVRSSQSQSEELFIADLSLYDDKNKMVACIIGVELKRAAIRQFSNANQVAVEHWYDVKWHEIGGAQSSTSIASTLTPSELCNALAPEAEELAVRHEIAEYESSLAELEIRAGHYVRYALTSMGWNPAAGDKISMNKLCTSMKTDRRHDRLFRRMLAMLVEDGILVDQGNDEFEVTAALSLGDLPDDVDDSDALRIRCPAELTLLDRCGVELANVLQGRTDPMGLLFPKGQFSSVEALYKEAPYAKSCNRLLTSALGKCFEKAGPGATVRILEIGAGTGGTTGEALKVCDPDRTEYVFTDLSPLFLERARERYADKEFVEYAVFDAEQSASAQGFNPGEYDIVIAANVLHATANLEQVVRGVADLLAPGGCLLAIEGTRPTRWVDLTFGYTEGWWKFSDSALRPSHALITASDWAKLLSTCGFESTALLGAGYSMPSQEVFFARVDKSTEVAQLPKQRWLVIGDDTEYTLGICDGLRGAGATAEFRSSAESSDPLGSDVTGIVVVADNFQSTDVDVVFDRALDQSSLLSSIVRLVAIPDCDAKIWVATRGAQWLDSDELGDSSAATLWGLGRVIALEHPEQWGGLVDGDVNVSPSEAGRQVAGELLTDDEEDQASIRRGSRFVPRLERVDQPGNAEFALREDATYLVTGGLGGLGIRLAEWLAKNGAGQVALVSRREFPARSSWLKDTITDEQRDLIATIRRIESFGCKVVLCKGDVSEREFVQHLFNEFAKCSLPICGVLHCAVAMTGCPVANLERETLSSMFSAKIRATMLLDEMSRTSHTDFFVLFSSTTALLGVAGLGHYAAANQFMDSLAHERRRAGHSALTVNWGTWEIMRVASDDAQRSFSEAGMHGLTVDTALDALQRAITSGQCQSVIADVDWSVLKSIYEARRSRPFLANVSSSKARIAEKNSKPVDAEKFADTLSEMAESKRRSQLVNHIEQIVGQILGSSSSVSAERGFFDMGMDSLMAVELKSRLEASLDHELPSTLTFNYPTVDAVADFLLEDLFESRQSAISPQRAGTVEAVDVVEERPSTSDMSDEELEDRLSEKLRSLKLK